VPPVPFAPLAELLGQKSRTLVHAHQSPPDIRLRQKREKIAALDMRFQRYRKAEP
jgi:hypothetical protein